MNLTVDDSFKRLITAIMGMGEEARRQASDTDEYKKFIAKFPVSKLASLSADEYCVGKGANDSFCWWIERGLEPALGRYMPGTSRGHLVYFRKEDGSLYKHRRLQDLSDEEAVRYTLKIQSAIAAADVLQDIGWIDDDSEIFRRAGVEPRVTVGHGRKLRLLACYHPSEILPISSSDHLGHFLIALGCEKENVPEIDRPVARMLLLREYFQLAKQSVPDLSTRGFMLALYNPAAEMVPPNRWSGKDDEVEGDDVPASAYLLTWNPENSKLGGDAGVVAGDEQRWTCHSKQPKVGDTAYLIRLGIEPKGIVARGVVTQQSHEAPHWRDPSKSARYIHFRVEGFRSKASAGMLPMVMLSLAMPDQKWSPQTSGIGISDETAAILDKLWESGAEIHSLRHLIGWMSNDPSVRRDDWIEPYRETVALARSLRDDPARIDEEALDHLWRSQRNGITSVGPGALSNSEFKENLSLLAELTREIVAKPTAATLDAVEARWQRAVTDKTLTKMNRAVIRRVFSAASPESFTTLLREGDCQKLLALFKRQFELSPPMPSRTDWATLSAGIVWCLSQAGLGSDRAIETNTAAWQLVDYLTPSSDAKAQAADVGDPPVDSAPSLSQTRSGVTPVNLVLYGPPGTGKTHRTVDEAIGLLAPELLEGEPDRKVIKARFDEFVANGQIVFTTFHQSFSYEDFVEGLRAETDEAGLLRYRVVDGVFKQICRACRSASGVPPQRSSAFRAGEAISGYQVKRATTDILELEKPKGKDLPFGMSLLNELATLVRSGQITIDDIKSKRVFDKVPDSKLEPHLVNGYSNILPSLVERLASAAPDSIAAIDASPDLSPRVLIIDEINRGNVSRILGELITLIEPSKRAGMSEALTVILPYSKESFCVPANLHIIATMNTADRSLVGLDIALRRRFEFREMEPRPDLLDDVFVEGVLVGDLLRVMNERIELLLDRDHRLGHSYFLPLRTAPTVEQMARIFRSSVLPLLQEYFFEDWQRIRWVLNDHRKPEYLQFIIVPEIGLDRLFGSGVDMNEQSVRWHINEPAFMQSEAYSGVIAASA